MDYTHTQITETSFKDDAVFLKFLDSQSMQDVISRSKINAVSPLFIALLFLGFTPFHADHTGLAWATLVTIACLTAFRYAVILSYNRFINSYPVVWKRFHLLSICLVALFWSSLSIIVLFLYGLNWVCMFILIMISGLTSASTTSFVPRPNLSLMFISLVLLPVVIASCLKGGQQMLAIGFSISFYYLSLVIICKALHRRYRLSFARRYALKCQAEKLRSARDNLELRVKERTAELARANQILLEGEKRYNALFSGITDGVLVYFLTENPAGEKFVEANGVACRILGYSHEELITLSPADILPQESRENLPQIQEKLTTNQAILFEQRLIRKNGEPVTVEIHANSFEFRGQQAVFYMIRDIGERKKIQEMMIQTEKIMSVGGLAAGMAHEINNPLAGIIQTSQVLKNRMENPLPANLEAAESLGLKFGDIKRYFEKRGMTGMLDSLLQAGNRAADIVDNMLAFARKSASRFTREDIQRLMDKTLEIAGSDYSLKKKFDFKNIAIHRDYAPDLPPVACKPGELQQVFFNILSNGAQAMMSVPAPSAPPSFSIKIRAGEDRVRIDISDTGPGIEPEIQQRIFEPFYTTKPPGKGTGLGLYVSRMIIDNNHQGSLSIDSTPGKGTCFTIMLP
ncbi:MAG: ATP-binding protein, partial [Desulfobacterales bacterium]|nr:ATP-binding protein [Desulfobacterales bacterium]